MPSASNSTVGAQAISTPSPRLSASTIIVNGRNEVLLVQRNPKARSFGGFHVFPGGNMDKEQDQSLQMVAIRETFEESGLLLASSIEGGETSPLSDSVLHNARHAIHRQDLIFHNFLTSHQLKPDVESLLPFTEWITPKIVPRRYHTQFFIVFLPAASSSGFSSGTKREQMPKDDGGQEVIEARFIHPKAALEECRVHKINLMPPQFYILTTLADLLDGHINTATQRARVESLSRGLFGHMVINPRGIPDRDDNGRNIMTYTYEGDETRGGSKGRLHRAIVVSSKEGNQSEITLLRNFDIFLEIESEVFVQQSKM